MKVVEIDRCNYCEQAMHTSIVLGDYGMVWLDADGKKEHGTLGKSWKLNDYDSHIIYTRDGVRFVPRYRVCKGIAVFRSETKNLTVKCVPVLIHNSTVINTIMSNANVEDGNVRDSSLNATEVRISSVGNCDLQRCEVLRSDINSIDAYNIKFVDVTYKGDKKSIHWIGYGKLEIRGEIDLDSHTRVDELNIRSKLSKYIIKEEKGLFTATHENHKA